MYYAQQGGATKIGAEFAYSLKARALRVIRVDPGRTAEKVGLRAGDEILGINSTRLDPPAMLKLNNETLGIAGYSVAVLTMP